jgi:hypothetical protein
MPLAAYWREGQPVRGDNSIKAGTVIATFVNGRYPDLPTNNHAAIYMSQNAEGIQVIDQWSGKPMGANYRTIKWGGGPGRSNDGDAFSIVVACPCG